MRGCLLGRAFIVFLVFTFLISVFEESAEGARRRRRVGGKRKGAARRVVVKRNNDFNNFLNGLGLNNNIVALNALNNLSNLNLAGAGLDPFSQQVITPNLGALNQMLNPLGLNAISPSIAVGSQGAAELNPNVVAQILSGNGGFNSGFIRDPRSLVRQQIVQSSNGSLLAGRVSPMLPPARKDAEAFNEGRLTDGVITRRPIAE